MPAEIVDIRGKGAVFIRGFLECDSDRLRKRQDAGLEAVKDLGGEISVSYISKLSKMLEAHKVVKKVKIGRSYGVAIDEDRANAILGDNNFGGSVEIEMNTGDILTRSVFADYLDKHQMVRVPSDQRLPKEAFRLAMERYNKGELELVFATPKMSKQLSNKKGNTPQVWKP